MAAATRFVTNTAIDTTPMIVKDPGASTGMPPSSNGKCDNEVLPRYKRPDPFKSARLTYRALEPEKDVAFIQDFQQCSSSLHGNTEMLPVPQALRNAEHLVSYMKDRLLCIVMCISSEEGIEPTPIGLLTLKNGGAAEAFHRRALIGIWIIDDYQDQGYGTEAIRWVLNWGFRSAELHRIGLEVMGYNHGAQRLYERLGFKVEGIIREYTYFQGKRWDYFQLGMLASEWEEMQRRKDSETHGLSDNSE